MEDERKKNEEDDEDSRDPLAPFAPGTPSERGEEHGGLLSPRCTSLHRRTEGYGVYFCRVAAAVTGQKACGFHPASLPCVPMFVSLSLSPSRSIAPFPFLSLQPLFPGISLCPSLSPLVASRPSVRPDPPPFSSLPFRHTAVLLALFSLLATPLFMPPHSPRSVLPATLPASVFVRPAPSPISFSPFLERSFAAAPVPELNYLRFFVDTPCSPLPLRRTNRSRTRASRKIGTAWRTKSTRKKKRKRGEREAGRETLSEYRIHERAENAPRESRCERKGATGQTGGTRGDVPAKSDGIRRGRKEEEQGEKRRMLKRRRASGTKPRTGMKREHDREPGSERDAAREEKRRR